MRQDDDGMGTCRTSQVTQMSVLQRSDRFCTEVRTLAMKGYLQKRSSNFQVVMPNKY